MRYWDFRESGKPQYDYYAYTDGSYLVPKNFGAAACIVLDRDAERVRKELKEQGVLLVNLMSSPGSGKTTLLSRVITDLKDKLRIGVMEADIASSVDAETIEGIGGKAIQAHTDGMCHVDAGMTKEALDAIDVSDLDLVFLENVGNLICPAEYDTGAEKNVMILSVPEGDDKPLKYPLMFTKADVVVVNKIDSMEVFDFSPERFKQYVAECCPDAPVFMVSAATGEGIIALSEWVGERAKEILEYIG